MTTQFTGGNGLTGFPAVVHAMLMSNEASSGYAAYQVSLAKAGRSGYSFGPMQWDLKQNPEVSANLTAQNFFRSMLIADGVTGQALTDIMSIVSTYQVGQQGGLTEAQIATVNQALLNQRGSIDAQYPTALDYKIAQVDSIIAGIQNAQDRAFLQTDAARAYLIDYHNQYNISATGPMTSYLNRGDATLGGGNAPNVTIQVQGSFGIEDLLKFAINTQYARETIAGGGDIIRRFSNMLNAIGAQSVTLSAEGAAFIRGLLSDARWGPIIGEERGLGIRNLLDLIRGPFTSSLSDAVRDMQAQMEQARAVSSPLILDLDGDGVETRAVGVGKNFDHDGNGFAEQTGWAASDDGLLVWDRNGNGAIDDGSELFGNLTVRTNGALASNGFQALSDLDGNSDAKVDSADSTWSQLRIWQDYDGDGVVGDGELRTLQDAGVASLGTNYTASAFVDAAGNEHRQVGTFTRTNGQSATLTDVWFKVDPAFTIATEILPVPAAIAALPDAKGFGTVYDLHQAMVRDGASTLLNLVAAFVAEQDPTARTGLVDQILYRWTGGDAIDPASRGTYMDARRVHVVEKFLGEAYTGFQGTNPHHNSAPLLNEAYRTICEATYSQLATQTHLASLWQLMMYTWDASTTRFVGDVSAVRDALDAELAANPSSGTVAVSEFARVLRGLNVEDRVDYAGFRDHFLQQGEVLAWAFDSAGRNERFGTSAGETVTGGKFVDTILGFEGNDTLTGADGDDALRGDSGDDNVSGENDDDLLLGDAGNDQLYGGAGLDHLFGGDGADYLSGDNGDDVLEGGAGNDTLDGKAGNDTYLFGRGIGQDVIYDWDAQTSTDRIVVAADVTPAEVSVGRLNDDLVLRIAATGEEMRINLWFRSGTLDQYSIQRVEFLADGTVWNVAQLKNLVIQGTNAAETLTGYDDTNDVSHAGGGNDTVYGRAGHDSLYGDAGNDLLYGEDGNDQLSGGDGADYLSGDNGDDVLDGSAGNDTLDGKGGNDTYLFGRGIGQDVIYDWDAQTSTDRIVVAADVAPAEVSVGRLNDDLVLRIAATGEEMRINWWFRSGTLDQYSIQRVEFLADGTVWNVAQLKHLAIQGTAASETIVGYDDSNDDSHAAAGNDTVYGRAGNDALYGDAGNDVLYGENGNDQLFGGDGADYLSGDNGDDVLDGSAGNDTLDGKAGNDTYLFGRGIGQDVIYDWDAQTSTDRIVVAADVAPAEVSVGRLNDDLVLRIAATGEEMRINWWFRSGTLDQYSIQRVEFLADGTVWNVAQLKNLVIQGTNAAETITGYDDTNDVSHAGAGNDIVYGRAGNDTLHGDAGDDQLHGEDGNDQLFGGDGADYLNGGNGDDVLTGGIGNDAFDGRSGADTYAFGRGVGQDIIYDWDGQTNLDRILVAADTRSDEVSVSRSVDELVLQITPTGDQQTVHWWFRGGTQDLYSLRQVDFADGTVWDVARLQELSGAVQGGEAADTLNGTAGANVLRGFGGNDSLSGAAGNDELEGGAGADTLSGDAGNDTLRGGLGADTYVFGTGGGGDTVVENDATPSTNDTLRFGSSIDPLDVILTRNVNDLVLAVHGSTDQVTVKDWYVGGAREIETIEAADGSELLSSQVQQLIQDMATYSATSGLTWAQAIDQRPEEVETVLGAHWQPGS